jgi:hypothetical protein
MSPKASCVIALAGLVAMLAGCATGGTPAEGAAPREAARLAPFMYYTEGRLVFFLVNSRPAPPYYGEDQIPLEIAVANKRLDSLTVDPEEGFTLIDPEGRRWPAATLEEMGGLELSRQFDLRTQTVNLQELLQNRFGRLYRFFAPNFGFTARHRSYTRIVELPKFAYTSGYILVARPEGEIDPEARYELWLTAPELEEPIFVPFKFPAPAN